MECIMAGKTPNMTVSVPDEAWRLAGVAFVAENGRLPNPGDYNKLRAQLDSIVTAAVAELAEKTPGGKLMAAIAASDDPEGKLKRVGDAAVKAARAEQERREALKATAKTGGKKKAAPTTPADIVANI
jgi:hypothetical protein